MKNLNLKKKVISVLTDEQMQSVNGGGTTSFTECTGFLCCTPKPCVPASEGVGQTCLLQNTCNPERCPVPGTDPSFSPSRNLC